MTDDVSESARLARNEKGRRWRLSKSRPRAKCHPKMPHKSRGLCDRCYNHYLYQNNPRYKRTKKRVNENWRTRDQHKTRRLQRIRGLRYKYGITHVEFDTLHRLQEGRCANCGRVSLNDKDVLQVDHCHSTGIVRGLLCLKCNAGLGMFGDRLSVIEAAVIYMKARIPTNAS